MQYVVQADSCYTESHVLHYFLLAKREAKADLQITTVKQVAGAMTKRYKNCFYTACVLCGGVDCNTTPFQTFPVHHWGQWRFRFFGQKNLTAQRPGLPLGTNIEGTWAHALNFFTNWLFRLTREKVDFRQNFGIFLRANGPS